jgi:hypothetical protein
MRSVLSAGFVVILTSVMLWGQSGWDLPAQHFPQPLIFGFPEVYDAGAPAAQSVTMADVNGDGKLDLLVADETGVAVLLGNGDGTFQAAVNYSSGGFDAYSVAVGDVNGDGKLDLVVANFCYDGDCPNAGGGGVAVLLGNGDGTFDPAVTYDVNNWNNSSVVLADLNGDGKLDIVVGGGACADGALGCTAGRISVLLGNGDGTFGPPTFYNPGGFYTQAVAVADVNGDGKPDILAGSCSESQVPSCNGGRVAEFLGNGDGTFQPPVFYSTGGVDAMSIAVADVNGDGNLDLLVANGAGVGELLGNGDGGFQTKAIAMPNPPYSLALGDVNGDGKLDLVLDYVCTKPCPIAEFGAVGIALGYGDGTFQLPNSVYSSGGVVSLYLAVGDVNGDGKPDVAVANVCGSSSKCVGDGTVGVLLNGVLLPTTPP